MCQAIGAKCVEYKTPLVDAMSDLHNPRRAVCHTTHTTTRSPLPFSSFLTRLRLSSGCSSLKPLLPFFLSTLPPLPLPTQAPRRRLAAVRDGRGGEREDRGLALRCVVVSRPLVLCRHASVSALSFLHLFLCLHARPFVAISPPMHGCRCHRPLLLCPQARPLSLSPPSAPLMPPCTRPCHCPLLLPLPYPMHHHPPCEHTGEYPWNQPLPANGKPFALPPLVTRVTGWDAVQARVEALWAEHHEQR